MYVLVLCLASIGVLVWLCINSVIWLMNKRNLKMCSSKTSLEGKTIIVTGASSGIGKASAEDFARRKGKVILACRNVEKSQKVADEIIALTGNKNVFVRQVDTSSLSSVRSFSKEILQSEDRLDILALNAGISELTNLTKTDDGLEKIMATNHFGHFLMANMLIGLLKKSAPSRIVVTSSRMQFFVSKFNSQYLNFEQGKYNGTQAYALSKLCNALFTKYFGAQLLGKGVTVNCFCPGLVATNLFPKTPFEFSYYVRLLLPQVMRTSEDGAQTLIHLAVSEDVKDISGAFFTDCEIATANALTEDAGIIQKVWERSETYVDLKPEERG